ncbi:hypothetical protein CHU92_11235 [Flavobacterium cyanobacteriorum]|uniref:Uncharacterized protein n=1 Tax=Flavobacterium cyanobacteriorum TaxID=2022802 RepID=A0A255Z343_9FLAO|nr:hypothetical protein CHU92_11235 [Flavobacterium cyanobacteriorum]
MKSQLHYNEQKYLLSKKAEILKQSIQELIDSFNEKTNSKLMITNYTDDGKIDVMVCINNQDFMNLTLEEE